MSGPGEKIRLARLFDGAENIVVVAIDHGARGVVFGRNVVQARDPQRLLEALKEVVKAGKAPDTTAKQYHLD
jgi:DhnA family fructose-bisphosphate aldolase class Ia